MNTNLFLVCQDVDLGYHVYAICSSKEKAEQYMEDYYNLRLNRWETINRDNFVQYTKGLPLYTLPKPKREDMHFYIEERILNEPPFFD